MKKLFILILLAGTVAGSVSAQNSFLLYSFKGNVSVIENKTETPAKVGKLLANTSSVKVSNGGTATLICNQAAMFTLGKGGTYALNKFGDSCKVSSNSVTNNYIKYVWAQLSESHGSPGSNRKAFMSTVGAVSRSINNIWVDPRLDTVNYSGGSIDFPLSWKSYADAKEFEFKLYSSDNITEPIYKTTVNKLKVSISSFASKLKPGKSYYWNAAIKGEENDEMKVLNYITKETFSDLLGTVKKQAAGFEATPEESYRIAFMLEDAHYLPEAYQYYSKAATSDPNNVLYRSTLMSFKKDYEIK